MFAYYDRVTELSRRADLRAYLVLSGALAHEMGHVLLQSADHSVAGVMRGEWGTRELNDLSQGLLRFTPQQKLRIRSNVVAARQSTAK